MKWFDNVIKNLYEKRSTLVGQPWQWLTTFPGSVSNSGQNVSVDNALNTTTVYSCVRLLSETIASLPLMIYERVGDGKELADSHNLFDILHNKPNDYQNSFEFREMITGHLLLRGNCYCFIERSAKRIKQLIPLNPAKMKVLRKNNKIIYVYTHEDGREETFKSSDIWHVKGLSSDGLVGLSPISLARESIGLAMAAEEYEARLFENDSRPSGILSMAGRLEKDAQERLKESWQKAFTGPNRHKVAVLEESMTWNAIGMSNNDAQFLELRKFQVIEICRIFRVPPHLVMDLDRSTFSNIEEQGIEFVQYSLRPWLIRYEQSMNNSLFAPEERKKYFVEHKVEGLLRGNTTSRYEAYSKGLNNGWLSINEIRSLENMNSVEDGDKYYRPLNLVEIGKPISEPVNAFGSQTQDNTGEKRGGEGSGNFGHAGRPGEIGGSAKGTGGKQKTSSKNTNNPNEVGHRKSPEGLSNREIIKQDFKDSNVDISDEDIGETTIALSRYSNQFYSGVRAVQQFEEDGKEVPFHNKLDKKRADHIEKWLENAPTFDKKATVYRGITLNKKEYDDMLNNDLVGSEFKLRGTSSFTSNEDVSKSFAGYDSKNVKYSAIIRIKDDNYRGSSIKFVSQIPQEDEVLLSKKNKVYVTNVSETEMISKYKKPIKVMIIDLESKGVQ